jgi:hypothetical protein
MKQKRSKNHLQKHNLPIIKCECGHKILFLPDLQAMGQAIENHALEHKRKRSLTQEETDVLEDKLIAQAFKLASESKN